MDVPTQSMILAGDIGGTKTYLGLFSVEGSRLRTIEMAKFRTADFSLLEDMVRPFMARRESVQVACFGAAGPVIRNRMQGTRVEVSNVEEETNERCIDLNCHKNAGAELWGHVPGKG